jgi:hypothetical protein
MRIIMETAINGRFSGDLGINGFGRSEVPQSAEVGPQKPTPEYSGVGFRHHGILRREFRA